jgi:Ca-activated chloride channel family protein
LSDGDANIGRVGHKDILSSIKGYVSEGVTLSTVGFGSGNYNDHVMEQLANAGNGNYSYVGDEADARRIFVDGVTGTLQVIAKDVKIQVEMNPELVKEYRLIGYENRDVHDEDFRNDKVDAGEIGAGHTVTALYEVKLDERMASRESNWKAATVRVRYKQPRGDKASEVAADLRAAHLKGALTELDADARFATAVMIAAEHFRGSPHLSRLGLSLSDAVDVARAAAVGPHRAQRRELVDLIAPLAARASVAVR